MKTRSIQGINNKNIFELVDDTPKIYACFDTDTRYGKLTLEQWGLDPSKKVWHVFIYDFVAPFNFSETWEADDSQGWETLRHTYQHAAAHYNRYAPEAETIPTF